MVAIRIPAAEQRIRLSCVPWEAYVYFTDNFRHRRIRVTYDRGEMEIMTISYKHERGKSLLARLVEMLSFELDIDIASGGSTTWRRQALQKGLEADECYWVQHEAVVRDLDNIDLENDPPPDLAIEVEMSRGTMDRMGIYAAMKVPEVWCWDGQSLIVHVLTARGVYRRNTQSNAFPFLPLD